MRKDFDEMYSVNDIVTYGLHGVCTISEITTIKMDGKQIEYYILKPIHDDNSTISIPVHNENLTRKIRPTLSKDEIYTLLKSLPEENDIWIENESLRVKQYKETLASANTNELLVLFKTLILRKQEQEGTKKKLHNIDERFYKSIESVLLNEFTYVLNTTQEKIQSLLFEYIQKEATV